MLDPLSGLTSCLGGVEDSLTLTSDLPEEQKVASNSNGGANGTMNLEMPWLA